MLEEIYTKNSVITDKFRLDCKFFDRIFNRKRKNEFWPLPFQNKKEFTTFDKKFWKNFYSRHLDFIASYWFRYEDILVFENVPCHRYQDGDDEYEFHFLCKLKNGFWMYIHMSSLMTYNFEWDCEDYMKIYVSRNLNYLVKYGIAVKNYKKVGIKLKSVIVTNCLPKKIYDIDGICPICMEDKNQNIFFDCGHLLCKKCLSHMIIFRRNLKCPKCMKDSTILCDFKYSRYGYN